METRLLKNERLPIELLLLADEAVEAINKYIHDSDVYVIEREKKIIGAYVLQKLDATSVEIKNVAVDNAFQRQGIGKFLLSDASRRAQEMGFERIIVGTADAATQLLHFYTKEGFEMFDIKRNFFIDNYPTPLYEDGVQLKDMIMFKKELAPKSQS